MMAPLLAGLLVGAGEPAAVPESGMCVGLGWLTAQPGEVVETVDGPDFKVYYFSVNGDPDHGWGVYWGNFAQVEGNGPTLLKRDGVIVRRAIEDDKFGGYLAERDGEQNHFFGSVFDGSKKDEAFFDRVDFGAVAQNRCRES